MHLLITPDEFDSTITIQVKVYQKDELPFQFYLVLRLLTKEGVLGKKVSLVQLKKIDGDKSRSSKMVDCDENLSPLSGTKTPH